MAIRLELAYFAQLFMLRWGDRIESAQERPHPVIIKRDSQQPDWLVISTGKQYPSLQPFLERDSEGRQLDQLAFVSLEINCKYSRNIVKRSQSTSAYMPDAKKSMPDAKKSMPDAKKRLGLLELCPSLSCHPGLPQT